MSNIIPFNKYHGLGNDFIIIDTRLTPLHRDINLFAQAICDRHRGIGADGLILVFKSDKADYRWRIINPDGSEAEMCGNGIRCLGKYIADREKKPDGTRVTVETLAGIKTIEIIRNKNNKASIKVDMGKPILDAAQVPTSIQATQVIDYPFTVGNEQFGLTAVSMGNPHAVIFVNDVSQVPLAQLGPTIERDTAVFPKKTNVEFVQVINNKHLKMRVWERGAGETQACGTGACATAVAGYLNNLSDNDVKVSLPGGDLQIYWDKEQDTIFMTGDAEFVFQGNISTL